MAVNFMGAAALMFVLSRIVGMGAVEDFVLIGEIVPGVLIFQYAAVYVF